MEGKNEIKISLSTFFLILAIIVIAVMGYFIYKFYTEKEIATNKAEELQGQISSLEVKVGDAQKNNSNADNMSKEVATNKGTTYNQNFNKSVFNILNEYSGDENEPDLHIEIPIWAYSGYSNIRINNKHEAYWSNSETLGLGTKVASNVVNAWYCPLGQDIEANGCVLFLKENGNVTYIRFYMDQSQNGNSFVNCTEERELSEISNISNVLVVEGGFYGVIFIKEDGSAMQMSLTKLDDLTNSN